MRIALFGYGKMGKEIEQIALSRGHEVFLRINATNSTSLSNSDLQQCEVAIEFSAPHSAVPNMTKCFDAGIPIVVGTTGWYDKIQEVTNSCKEKNGSLFYTSNFSVGVNLFFKLNEQLAKMMNTYPDYNVSMEETHHIHKLDAPSGTAITLANGVINNLKRKSGWQTITQYEKGRSGETEKHSDSPSLPLSGSDLLITSIRKNEVPGTHTVKYQSAIDDIEITHKAHNRKGFALGAVLAAEFIKNKKGVFGMNDLMTF